MEASKITACAEAVKRLWRRRRYQRLPRGGSPGRRRLKVVRLGVLGDGRMARTTTTAARRSRLRLKLSSLSPLRLLARFHDAYVEMMMGVAIGVARCKTAVGKGAACREDNQVSVGSTGDEVDQRLLLEVYRRIAASRQLVAES
ncbi:hypothetical protein MLD38_017514 [Melastoma candidum]|uniref:Uncharacterized protein n=1 Tax=Melastoma candidum TaxID=119954 RepID=A0ACB9QTZ6_9MYRT|nr:hypothetical protein MLD38_017514 [Melastoma candidum]